MIGPSGSKGRPGAAAGLPGPPPRAMASFCSNIGRLTATGRVADAPIPASPGRSGLCLRNPVTLIDGAMHWAADHDGSPLADVCEGNPGRLFSGQGYVPVSMACSAWLLPRTRRRRHEALRLESQTAVDRSERNLGRRNAGNDGRATGANHCRMWPWPAPPLRWGHRRKGRLKGSAAWRRFSRPSSIMVSMSTGSR